MVFVCETALVQARYCPDSGCRDSLHPGLVLSFYHVHSISCGPTRYAIVCTRYSEPPRYGVSWSCHSTGSLAHHGTDTLGAGGAIRYGVPRRRRYGTESPDTCLLKMFHWGAHSPHNGPLGCIAGCSRSLHMLHARGAIRPPVRTSSTGIRLL